MAKQSALKHATQKKHAGASGLRELKASQTRSLAPELDRLIHERLRLGIVSALAGNDRGNVRRGDACVRCGTRREDW